MDRCKTLLSAGSIVLLICATVPDSVEATVAVEIGAQSQTAARSGVGVAGDQDHHPDVLGRLVTLNLVEATLGSALETIARLAGFTLAYGPAILPAGKTVTLNAADLPAHAALAHVLGGTGLEPTMTRTGQLTLMPRPDPQTHTGIDAASEAHQAVVTGAVTDEATGEPLRGVQVRVDESELATVTDAEGRYTLEDVPPGSHTLVARIIGYREARQGVTVAAGTTVSVDFALAVSALPLDEVVVTGTMVPTQMRAVPSPVSVITAADIERKGEVRVEDILRSIPGVGVATNSGPDHLAYVHVRGSSRTTGTNTIKTYIDGVEVANPLYTLNQIDAKTIDRIELIRGPQASTLYGSDAIAGVLQVFTKKGQTNERARIRAALSGGGLQSQYKESLTPIQAHSVSISGGDQHVSFSAGASYTYTGEWVEDELIDELGWDVKNSTSTDTDLTGGIRYVNGDLAAEAFARIHWKSRGGPLEKAVTEAARTGRIEYPAYTKPTGNESDVDLATYGATVSYRPTSEWLHTLTVGHDASGIEFRRRQPRFTTPADSLLIYQSASWVKRSVSYKTALDLPISARLSATVQAGIDRSTSEQLTVLVNDARQLQGGLGNETANVTRGTLTNSGYFAQTQISWRDQLSITAGIRADKSTAFGDGRRIAWAPRFGVAHILGLGGLTLKSRVAFGEAIRPPEPQQKLGETLANFVTLPNDRLAPEAQSGYDFGWDILIGDRHTISVTRYHQIATDLIALVRLNEPTAIPQVQQYQNVGRIRNTGWELEGTVRLPPVTLTGHFSPMESAVESLSPTYTGGDFAIGAPTLDTPRRTGGFAVTLSEGGSSLTISGNYKGVWQQYHWLPYLTAIYGTDPNRDPYTGNARDYIRDYDPVWRYELNASAWITGRIMASLMIDNLLNNERPDQRDINLVRGRRVLIGLRFESNL